MARETYPEKDLPDTGASSWADQTERFPEDQYLRLHRFQIYSRARAAEAVWARLGKHYRQTLALAVADQEQEQKGRSS